MRPWDRLVMCSARYYERTWCYRSDEVCVLHIGGSKDDAFAKRSPERERFPAPPGLSALASSPAGYRKSSHHDSQDIFDV